MHQVIIIGAGLSGLTAAYELKKAGIQALILEARNRLGGRIFSLQGPIEMGATWFGPQHRHLIYLLNELNFKSFPQFVNGKVCFDPGENKISQQFDYPLNQAPSFRIEGGSSVLIKILANSIGDSFVEQGQTVTSIYEEIDHLIVSHNNVKRPTSLVINTIPPQLFASKIKVSPKMNDDQLKLMQHTHTWMGESIKFAFTFDTPFWKDNGMSGMGFSQSGVILEVHDHSNASNDFFALKGFLNPDLSSLNDDLRKELVVKAIIKLFGQKAGNFTSYQEVVWGREPMTSLNDLGYLAPHQNNGHPLLSQPLMNGKLIMAGSETSTEHAGYMDGAVIAGLRAANEALTILQNI
jgi:monoamine oxidase